jgi:glucose-6-phosphate isomerase
MYRMLAELCGFYIQDHDLIYEQDTDPIDQFCEQHNVREQREALAQMKDFREAVLAGKRTLQDLVYMGLGWHPLGGRDLATWLQRLIDYLEAKIANSDRRET